MNRNTYFLEVGLLSGLIAVISQYLGAIRISFIILLVLMVIDTFTGISKALKLNKFRISGLKKLIKKVITYSTCILTVRLLEIGIEQLIETTLLSQLMVAFLVISETVSILENLTLLGVPIPSNFIAFIIGNIKIPGLGKAVGKIENESEKYLAEIEDIITYQVPTFENECTRKLLEIKFEVWKDIAIQVDDALTANNQKSNERIYYRILSMAEAGIKELDDKWKEAGVSKECVNNFNRWHQPKVNDWLEKLKQICFSEHDLKIKKQEVIDSIIVVLYQTIVDARKGL